MSSTPREIGTLIVVVFKARNLPNKRHIGKQDPYCTVILDGEKRRTKAIKRGGQHPEWDEEIRFTIYEDDTPERLPPGNGTPPPPPPKKSKGPPKIKGGNFMTIACWAEDIREPDFIGDTRVDLNEVLTKGETDEWFTLMSKDKYSGEVYLELTFWSNEPAPVKKPSPKPEGRHNYGGPGTFTPSGRGHSPSPSPNGFDRSSHRSRVASMSRASEDSIPSALRASNPSAKKFDLYTAPYETSRSHQQMTSVDSLTNDFAEFGVQDHLRRRRLSYTPTTSGFSQPASQFVDQPPFPSQPSYGYESGSYSSDGGQHRYSNSVNQMTVYQQPTASYTPPAPGQYFPPYESAAQSYITPPRRNRYSVPSSSSGFAPVQTPASSGFSTLPPQPTGFSTLSSQPTGLPLQPAATPAPVGYGHPPPPATPAPLGYGPPPAMPPPAPTPAPYSVPPAHMIPSSSFPQPSPTPNPYNASTIRPSVSYQQLPQSSFPHQQPYTPPAVPVSMSQPYLPSHTPAPPPNPVPQHSTYVPPPPSLPPPPASSPPDQGFGVVQQFAPSQSQINVPPPPPLHDNPSPVYAQGSRPLPQPQQPRRQSTLPTPPMTNGGFIPTNVSNQQIAPVSPNPAYNNSIPPPPPLPAQQQVPFPPSPQHLNPGPPPPLPTGGRIVSSSFPVPPRSPVPGSIPMVVPPPPPLNPTHTRRASLPAPPPFNYGQQQPTYQALPPPPVPPTLPQQTSSAMVRAFPTSSVGQAMYPGPLPRPPSQYIPPSYSYPTQVSGGGWQ